jgi:hypothetical protein
VGLWEVCLLRRSLPRYTVQGNHLSEKSPTRPPPAESKRGMQSFRIALFSPSRQNRLHLTGDPLAGEIALYTGRQ